MISIQKYNNKILHLWDDFISNSNNGTIFNSQKFLSYHISRTFDDNSLLFFSNRKLIAVLPAVIINNHGRRTLYSHPGASFGGLIISNNLSFSMIDDILSALERYCIDDSIEDLILINTPMIYYKKKDDSLNYLLLLHDFQIHENYISHYIDTMNEKYLINLLNKRKKRYLKQSISDKRFIFYNDSSIDNFYKILLDSKEKFHSKPTHSVEELKKIQNLFPQKIKLLISKDKNKIAGGTLVFHTTKATCLIFYNVVSSEYRNSQLAALQLFKCMQSAKKQNSYIIDLGVSHTPEQKNPLNPKKSLIQFKEQFGATGVLRTIYKKQFNEK
jgi:hypothetical protein